MNVLFVAMIPHLCLDTLSVRGLSAAKVLLRHRWDGVLDRVQCRRQCSALSLRSVSWALLSCGSRVTRALFPLSLSLSFSPSTSRTGILPPGVHLGDANISVENIFDLLQRKTIVVTKCFSREKGLQPAGTVLSAKEEEQLVHVVSLEHGRCPSTRALLGSVVPRDRRWIRRILA